MSINPSSLNRITGLASGMDTDSLVKKLMSGEQVQIDQLKQKQQKDTWLSEAYRQWNTDLFSFKTSTLFNMKFSSTYNTFNASSSMPNSVTGTTSGSTIAGTYNIQVKQLAQSASFTGNKIVLDSTKTLGDAAQGASQLTANTTLTLTVFNDPQNPKTSQTGSVAINTTDKIGDVISKINSATDSSGKSLGLQAIYDSNLQQFIVRTKSTGAATEIDFTGNTSVSSQMFLSKYLGLGTNASVTGTGLTANTQTTIAQGSNDSLTISIDGGATSPSITLAPGLYNTTQDLVNEINNEIGNNSALANKVWASVDKTGNITLSSAAVNGQNSINVSGNGTTALGLPSSASGTGKLGAYTASGKNADIIFNGNEINTLSSNTATIMGVNWTFTSPTVDASGNPTTSTVNVTQNIDAEVQNIKDFIGKYNDLLDKLNTAYSGPLYKDYQPLTDDQRSAMSDTQIQQWETKAKSGLLHSDSILNSLINNIRNDMVSVVSNGSTYNSLASIGISSSSYMDKGKLYIDDTKLRTAIQNDPDAVRNLFSNLDTTNSAKNGIMNKLDDDLSQAITSLTDKAGAVGNSQYDQSTIGQLLTSIQTQISTKQDSFNTTENRYYAQFSAMETAMSKYSSQSNWLTAQLSGGK